MRKALILALALSLTGCATQDWVQRHPRASAVIAATVVTSVALSTRGHSSARQFPMSEPLIATPSVDCSKVSCR